MIPDLIHVNNALFKLENLIQSSQRIPIRTVIWREDSIQKVFINIKEFNPNSA